MCWCWTLERQPHTEISGSVSLPRSLIPEGPMPPDSLWIDAGQQCVSEYCLLSTTRGNGDEAELNCFLKPLNVRTEDPS